MKDSLLSKDVQAKSRLLVATAMSNLRSLKAFGLSDATIMRVMVDYVALSRVD